MSYDPSSGQPGGTPPDEGGSGTQGGYEQQPPQGGDYGQGQGQPTRNFQPPGSNPPPSGQETYMPGSTSGAGMGGSNEGGGARVYGGQPTQGEGEGARVYGAGGQPPAEGGYMPPAQGSAGTGGYTPPPPGYTPPTGGYGAPPPPPPPAGMGGMGGMGGMDQAGLQNLFSSYINAVTKPNPGTYEREIPNASWIKVLIGVAAVAIISALVALLFAGTASATFDQIQSQINSQGGTRVDLTPYRALLGGGSFVTAFIGPFIGFFLGSGLLYFMARVLGGQPTSFLTHSYLLSLSYTPLRIAAAVLNIIPCVGAVAGIALFLYQLYSAGLAMQANQRMASGRAQMAAFLPTILLFGLACICSIAGIALGVAALGSLGTTNP